MSKENKRVLTGSTGKVWLNNELLGELKAIEAKVAGGFEEVNFCGDNATYYTYTGWTGEGTLTMNKVNSRVVKLLKDSFKTGEFPEVKIVTSLTDVATKKSERVSVESVQFTEMSLAKFEAKSLIEEELPFNFSDYEVLETL